MFICVLFTALSPDLRRDLAQSGNSFIASTLGREKITLSEAKQVVHSPGNRKNKQTLQDLWDQALTAPNLNGGAAS